MQTCVAEFGTKVLSHTVLKGGRSGCGISTGTCQRFNRVDVAAICVEPKQPKTPGALHLPVRGAAHGVCFVSSEQAATSVDTTRVTGAKTGMFASQAHACCDRRPP